MANHSAADFQFPLWSRFWRLFLRKARPTVRDLVVALIALVAATVLKVVKGDLRWSLSKSNLLEAQFPVVVVLVVFCIWNLFITARSLYKEVKAESGEIEYNPYPSIEIPGGPLRERKKIEIPHLRTKIVVLTSMTILFFCALGVLSWKAASIWEAEAKGRSSSTPTPSPQASQAPTVTPEPSVANSPKPHYIKRGKKEPCSADDRLRGLC